jgi:hypothetical protein
MERQKLLGILISDDNYSDEQVKLFHAIEDVILELDISRNYFNSVSDPNLVDYAIYMEDAAKAKYAYLLAEAKRLNLKIDYSYKMNKARAV